MKLGKSEGGGGGEGGRRQWKNCEMCLAKFGPIFFFFKTNNEIQIYRLYSKELDYLYTICNTTCACPFIRRPVLGFQ